MDRQMCVQNLDVELGEGGVGDEDGQEGGDHEDDAA